MKRSRHVTLVLLGTTALVGCNDDRTAPPQPTPKAFTESLALPVEKTRCDRPTDFPLPECHDPQATASRGTTHGSGSGGHGAGFFWFFHGGGSSYGPSTPAAQSYASAGSAVRAAAPAGTTSFGGFGASGRGAASGGGT